MQKFAGKSAVWILLRLDLVQYAGLIAGGETLLRSVLPQSQGKRHVRQVKRRIAVFLAILSRRYKNPTSMQAAEQASAHVDITREASASSDSSAYHKIEIA